MQDYFLGTVMFALPEQIVSELQGNMKQLEDGFQTTGSLPQPHITIYQAKFPIAQKQIVIQTLTQICSQHDAPEFEYAGSNIKNNYVGIAFQKTESLMLLHEAIVKALNPIRNGAIKSAYVEHRDNFSQLEQDMIDTRGYPYVFDNYVPHVALVLLASSDDIDRAVSYVHKVNSFVAKSVELIMYQDGIKISHLFACKG